MVAPAAFGQTAGKPDLREQPTLYVVGYAHLDTRMALRVPAGNRRLPSQDHGGQSQAIREVSHYIFNFSGANRYRLMKEYFPADYAKMKVYIEQGRWFPAGSSMEEGDVNAPSAEGIFRQVLYGTTGSVRYS